MLSTPVSSYRRKGQSFVEVGLALPILVFLLIGGLDLARAFSLQIAVENGSRAGAESFAIDSTPTIAEAKAAAIAEINRTPTANVGNSNVTITKTQADGVSLCVSPPTIAVPCYVTVNVQYAWTTLVAWPLVPNGGTLNRTTTVRTFY